MNENELKLLWQSANEKLEDNYKVNKVNTEEITKMKVQGFLSSMKPTKIFTLVVGIVWVLLLGIVLVNLFMHAYDKVSLFFLYSATIQVVITAIAVAVYIYQLDLISRTDFSQPVLKIQENLSMLKLSTLNVARILFLQLPVWTTFYLSEKMFASGNVLLWIIQGLVTLLFTCIAVWLFINIKFQNRNAKWFKWIFGGKEWTPIIQSMELLNQIEVYQKEESESVSH